MKRIFSIVLALVLALGLSLATATSVVAVQDVSVTVDPDTVGTAANYTIAFNISTSLQIGETIYIEFPSDTEVPPTSTYKLGDVTVQDTVQGCWNVSPGDISVVSQVVTIKLRYGIGAPDKVTVVFNVTAGITNPTNKGDYIMYVWTSQETSPVPSDPYTIRLSDYSTYEFVYQPEPEDMMIYRDEPAGVNVTLRTDVEGLAGYNHTRITFNVTGGPPTSTVTFNVSYGGVWYPYLNSGYCPASGNFSVNATHNEIFPFRLTFNKVGVYAIEFVLEDLDHGRDHLEEDEISFAVTGDSVEVKLNKGWNLMSLPIIPDDKHIEDVLADIMGDFISVHYYDPLLLPNDPWLIYSLDPYFHSLTTMEDGKAYWINMIAAANLTVVGQAIAAPGGQPPPTYDVWEGWNMVGFKSMAAMKAEDYLAGLDPIRIYGFNLTVGGWFSLTPSSHNMTPGLGYWVAFSERGIIYP
jgi:hypothetical protein